LPWWAIALAFLVLLMKLSVAEKGAHIAAEWPFRVVYMYP